MGWVEGRGIEVVLSLFYVFFFLGRVGAFQPMSFGASPVMGRVCVHHNISLGHALLEIHPLMKVGDCV